MHTAHARVTHGTRAQTLMIVLLEPVPNQGIQELWRVVQFQRDGCVFFGEGHPPNTVSQ